MLKTTKTAAFIPVCEPVLEGNEEKYVLECLRTNWISSSGKFLPAFEQYFSRYCGAQHGVACSSGTAALHLAYAAMGLGPGDEVIMPSFNLIAGAISAILTGAKVVLADVRPDTWCLDPADVERKITPRTKAVLAVHMYGHPCDMDALAAITKPRGIRLIEDGAEAHGAEYKGRRVGALSDAAAFSFYGNKVITTGEGGMVVTNDAALAERCRLLRNQAFEEPRFVHRHMGFNYRLTNMQAAIGLAQCETLDTKVARKRSLAAEYTRRLSGQQGLQLPAEAPWAKSVFWMYGVVLDESFGCSRNQAMRLLQEQGVDTRAFFYPLNHQPLFLEGSDARFPDKGLSYPVSERLGRDGLYLPSGKLTEEQIDQVVAALLACRGAGR